jgi:hypothetical protein
LNNITTTTTSDFVKNKDESLIPIESDISGSSEMYKSQKLFNNNKSFTNCPESERKITNLNFYQTKLDQETID